MSDELRSPEVLREAIEQIAAIAKEEGVKVILVGGFAMHLYGSDRLTGDVDFASAELMASVTRSGRQFEPLSFGGYATHAPNGVPVDMIVRDDDYTDLYLEAIRYAVKVDGVPIPVVSPEYLAAMKMASARDKDFIDLGFLLQKEKVNVKQARSIVRKHLGAYAAQEFDGMVEEAEWMRTRKNPRARRGRR